ncbi:TRAP transporter large permease [Aeromicrobium sp.]|uniref:TRAP transporter large permease n=1 Tax=Aeromicrobium sp. TaxID=1871063 RepID=UPI0028ADD66A|nr:TRAP transporter large permease [Aeromicrobium sp.]
MVSIGAFLALVFLNVPVSISLLSGSVLGILMLHDTQRVDAVLGAVPYSAVANYGLFVVPMYILLGCLIANTGIGERIYRLVHRLVRRLPGGLPAATVGATAAFSGISGSSAADVAAFGRVSINEMARYGYSRAYAGAVVAAAGTFAVLIPPSVILVVYALLAGVNIGAMILAAVVPGLISCLALMAYVMISSSVHQRSVQTAGAAASRTPDDRIMPASTPSDAEPASDADDTWRQYTFAAFTAVTLFAVVVGGLYGGYFTATESGAVGALVALTIGVCARKSRDITAFELLKRSLRETAEVSSMIFMLLISGSVFTYYLASAQVPARIATWVLDVPASPTLIVALSLLLLLPVGLFLDSLSTMLLFIPVMVPVMTELGFDGIWYGILAIKMIEIGLITPPVGLNVFVAAGVGKVKAEAIFRRVLPFIVLDLAVTAVFFVYPESVLWLPRQAGLM